MNKKILIFTIAILVIILLGGVAYFAFSPRTEKTTTLDLATINEEITAKGPFWEMSTVDLTKDTMESIFEIESNKIEEVVGKMPMMNVHASMFFVIKAIEGQADTVKQQVEEYAKNYEKQWSMYLPEQYELVQNRKVGIKGNYIYLIIAENAEELEKLVK